MGATGAILAIEDTEDDVALVRRAFRKADLSQPLFFVHDGDAAVDYLAGNGAYADRQVYPLPSLVLLDLKLPRKSGLEVLEWIRAERRLLGLPVVVLTSSRHARDLQRAYELGANSYLVKPLSFSDLVHMVAALKLYWMELNEAPRLEGA